MKARGPATNPPSDPRAFDSVPTRRTSTPPSSAPSSAPTVGAENRSPSSSTSSAPCRRHAAAMSLDRRHVSVHGEHHVGDHERRARGLVEELLEVVHVAMAVDGDLGLRQAAPVDDRRVVVLVGADAHARCRRRRSTPRGWRRIPVGNTAARSVPVHVASASSSSSCTGRLPETSRLPPDPVPQWSSASWAAATTAGCSDRPR